MAPHWKFGNGFAIRYGGYKNIKWFFGQNSSPVSGNFSLSGLAANLNMKNDFNLGLQYNNILQVHPVQMALEVLNVAANFLQWWEMRKQSFLQGAQFEERRIPWLVDILNTFYSEIKDGELRRDTIFYFEREITKLFKKIEENELIDLPSSLLLQIDRTTRTFVQINSTLSKLIFEGQPNFVLPGQDYGNFQYRPYSEFFSDGKFNGKLFETYLTQASGLAFAGLGVASNLLALHSPIAFVAGKVALWGYKEISEMIKKKDQKRITDFEPLRNLSIELRSCNAIIAILEKLPLTIWEIPEDKLIEGETGKITFVQSEVKKNA